MPVHVTQLSHFFRRLDVELDADNPTRFTWLIGAGMSVSSGIPLARDVSKRIILFEYFCDLREVLPWHDEKEYNLGYTNKKIQDYLDWYEQVETNQEELLVYLEPALEWLRKNDHFENVTIDDPECYQLLFQHLISEPRTSIKFLTNLIARSKGVNLSHLALAGLLRDYPKWGNTVFTTNFDDLALKALLLLNHSARIFGEYETSVKPGIVANYPQIVHLHGKHTGYTLLNTKEQLSLVSPNMQAAFETHIADSNLIIIGYSGWDNLVINTLSKLKDNPELIRGSIYWVPYLSEETMLTPVYEFLDSLPHGKVQILVNEDHTLTADSFMLEMLSEISKKETGFAPFRKEILNNAKNHHAFLLDELKKYPDYSPDRAFNYLDKALHYAENNDKKRCLSEIQKALPHIESDDLSTYFRAKGYQAIGSVYLMIGENEKGHKFFTDSVDLFKQVPERDAEAIPNRVRGQIGVSESLYELGHINKALAIARDGIEKRIRKHDIKDRDILFYQYVVHLKVELARGYITSTKHLTVIDELVDAYPNHELVGEVYALLSWREYLLDNQEKAKELCKKAITFFESRENKLGVANSHILLATIHLDYQEIDEAKEFLHQAFGYYKEVDNKLGLGNYYDLLGDISKLKNNFEEAKEYYSTSRAYYEEVNCKYNLLNSYKSLHEIAHHLSDSGEKDQLAQLAGSMEEDVLNSFAIESTFHRHQTNKKRNTLWRLARKTWMPSKKRGINPKREIKKKASKKSMPA